MEKIAKLKRRLFCLSGGLVLLLMFMIIVFNMIIVRNSENRKQIQNQKSLQESMKIIDFSMENIENMLVSQNTEDVQLQTIKRPRNEIDWYLALLEKQQFFREEIGNYRLLDGIFMYDKHKKAYIGVKGENVSSATHTLVKTHCLDIIEYDLEEKHQSEWFYLSLEGKYYIFRVVQWKNIYFCAWMQPENIVADIQEMNREKQGYYLLTDKQGVILNSQKNIDALKLPVGKTKTEIQGEKYNVLWESQKDEGYFKLFRVEKDMSSQKVMNQILLPIGAILMLGSFSLILVLVLTSEMIINPVYRIFIEEERKKNQAQLQFLQIQTNPHFLNNCLSLIRNLIVLRKNKEAEIVTLELGKFIRGYINAGTKLPLKQEMKQVNTYYELQRIRYKDRLKIDVYMDEQAEGILVPAMSVQTFVENSVKHQMKLEETLYISILIRMDEEKRQLVIRIRDNGSGFSEEVLRQLKENVPVKKEEKEEQEHIGIHNLVQRIKILYKDKAEIRFENAETGGAVVTMVFPEMREKSEKKTDNV